MHAEHAAETVFRVSRFRTGEPLRWGMMTDMEEPADVQDADPWNDPVLRYRPADGNIALDDDHDLTALARKHLWLERALSLVELPRVLSFAVGGIGVIGSFYGWTSGPAVFGVCAVVLIASFVVPIMVRQSERTRRMVTGYPVPGGLQNVVFAGHGAHDDLLAILEARRPALRQLWACRRLRRRIERPYRLMLTALDAAECARARDRRKQWEAHLRGIYLSASGLVDIHSRLTRDSA